MSYVASDARWFIAELILKIEVEGEQQNVVHRNYVLVEADSAEHAYESSLRLGKESEVSYQNPQGKNVSIKFCGIADLDVIGRELEHGTEILFTEQVGVSEETLLRWIRPKERLSIFSPIEPSAGPNYASQEVIEDVARILKAKKRSPKKGSKRAR
jgi:hypothetical protein